MPSSANQRTIAIRIKLRPIFEAWHKGELEKYPAQTNPDFGGWINEKLWDKYKLEEFMAQRAPHLKKENYDSNTLFIWDSKKNKRAEIYRYDDDIKCALCNSFDCEHIHFALGLPELAKLNIRKRDE